MLFENIERELANGVIGLASQLESYPNVDDCWEIAAKRQLKLSASGAGIHFPRRRGSVFTYRLLRNFKPDRSSRSFRTL